MTTEIHRGREWRLQLSVLLIVALVAVSATYRNPYEIAPFATVLVLVASAVVLAAIPLADPTWVYRFYAADGALLYVGLTRHLERRVQEHAAIKRWWPEVVRTESKLYRTRLRAARAEHAAIGAEDPRYNVARLTLAAHLRTVGIR